MTPLWYAIKLATDSTSQTIHPTKPDTRYSRVPQNVCVLGDTRGMFILRKDDATGCTMIHWGFLVHFLVRAPHVFSHSLASSKSPKRVFEMRMFGHRRPGQD